MFSLSVHYLIFLRCCLLTRCAFLCLTLRRLVDFLDLFSFMVQFHYELLRPKGNLVPNKDDLGPQLRWPTNLKFVANIQ